MKQRVITGTLAGAFYLALLWIGSIPFALLAAAIAVISYLELAEMNKLSAYSPEVLTGALAVAVIVCGEWISPTIFHFIWPKLIVFLALLFVSFNVVTKNRFSFARSAYLFLAVFYISIPFQLLVRIRFDSLALALFVQIIIWTTDSGAYFVGRKLGKNKLAPYISPNKTREGSIGAVIAALLVAALFQLIIGSHLLFGSWLMLFAVALLISLFGQLGDLVESAIKRFYDVKDSGTILPGHGGMLDRFDSLIFVLPLLYVLGFIG
ncbi:phosphatidate cytidylyltransferase [Sporolactobacillus shoreicorticis]|uniref:Phosphatidate cytidylyltransferase n=1 Tax=Sporolactobacillus shoreicorticis TaxID=1923877 RepID=A0ABW5SBL9_9BACL|nr:phosphatidate cytidylyltransferase [Sporolactobacillus shoreicorticis]MCO7125965.1 phosphatidate cytidylyltransferase [Sporolactobacillus shoreicorticis]